MRNTVVIMRHLIPGDGERQERIKDESTTAGRIVVTVLNCLEY